ncbi:hypothetical protein NXA99_07365 [Citrobacter amalonaticus]|uniref:hypothetical protein n=1 Tax=Citrobacter amalonaticus TaxID=35703 RepID=UPI00215CF3C6|nr:hypothetical protein [Citrobacter amalonaticus]MCR9028352.1 hypothetical protein [Citrobacter amalonaticus]
METPVNVFTNGYGNGYGGYGCGYNNGCDSLLALALLGGRGFGYGGYDHGYHHGGYHDHCCERKCATADDVMDIQQLSDLGDIKAAVPLAEAQTQLALAGAKDAIAQELYSQSLFLSRGQTDILMAQAAGVQSLSHQLCAVEHAVDKNAWQVSQTVQNDGEKTRALITANQIAELNRLAGERQAEIIELRHEHRRRDGEDGIRINMQNTTNQLQGQIQAQGQQQAIFNERCWRELCDVAQLAKATNAQINIGSGTLTGAAQTANPINTRI